jgi:hypothetical protein
VTIFILAEASQAGNLLEFEGLRIQPAYLARPHQVQV